MNGDEAAFLLVLLLIASALALIILRLILRHRREQMLHNERIAALDKGLSVPLNVPEPATHPRIYLLRGLMWALASAGLIISLLGMSLGSRQPLSATDMAYRADTLSRSTGIPLAEAQRIVESDRAGRRNGPHPAIALFGLVPLGVGLAYLVFYYTDGSRKGSDLARSETPAARG